jgi:hypothetical protein
MTKLWEMQAAFAQQPPRAQHDKATLQELVISPSVRIQAFQAGAATIH